MDIIDQQLKALMTNKATSAEHPTQIQPPTQIEISRTKKHDLSVINSGHIEDWVLLRIVSSFQSVLIEYSSCR